MVKKDFFKVQNQFVDDISELSGSAVKVYLILRMHVNEERNDGNKVVPSYKKIQTLLGTTNSNTVKKAIEDLIDIGMD